MNLINGLRNHSKRAVVALLLLSFVVWVAACASDDANDKAANDTPGYNNMSGGGGGMNNSDGETGEPPYVPEEKVEFSFSKPAIVGERVFVANETLNSVAVIDSRNLSVKTVLAGFRPTVVGGPSAEYASEDEARIMVLNEGSHSVTVIDPRTLAVVNMAVMPNANALQLDPRGRVGVAWFDDSDVKGAQNPGADLSSVTVIKSDGAYNVAVGFHVRSVHFDESGEVLLVLTDDGISRVELAGLSDDGFSAPISVMPVEFQQVNPVDLEIVISANAKFAVTRTTALRGLVLLDIERGEHFVVELPETPTDIEFIGSDALEILAVLRNQGQILRATVPEGLMNAASTSIGLNAPLDEAEPDEDSDADVGVDDEDADLGDTESDSGAGDADAEDVGNAGDSGGSGNEFPGVEGVEWIELSVKGLGAVTLSEDFKTALVYSTINDEKRAILLALTSDEAVDQAGEGQRVLVFEKGIRGALSDKHGRSFLVFHTKKRGDLPANSVPTDPEFVARSWGVSLLDVKSAATRLVLTQQKPGASALWAPDGEDGRVFMVFEQPEFVSEVQPSHRDVVMINLRSFRMDSFRLSSLPEGLGVIESARKVYISQTHPQGRMTFVDVDTLERQTVTGYQLNAGIE